MSYLPLRNSGIDIGIMNVNSKKSGLILRYFSQKAFIGKCDHLYELVKGSR